MADIRGSCICSRQRLNHWLFVLWVQWTSNEVGELQDVLIPRRIDGDIICVDTAPNGVLGVGYDIWLFNDHFIDVMGGALEGRSNAAAERAYPIYDGYIVRSRARACLSIWADTGVVKQTGGYVAIYFNQQEERGER
jgi:hypothetical protein